MTDAPTTQHITVEGMTCGHCVAAVRDEISQLPGVTSVEVDLDSGRVDIAALAPVDPAALATAVDEAGYSISEPRP
jgi:copper chaperone CopZ